jgi:branched-chain amino acid aminotransferase
MSADMPVWLNGRIVSADAARVSILDRGWTLADGVFETVRAEGERLVWLGDHLARLRRSAHVLGLVLPIGDAEIAAGLADLLTASGLTKAALRVTLTRGPAARRGLWPPGEPVTPTLAATIAPLAPPRTTLRVIVAQTTRRNEHSPLSGIKSLNYGDNLLARREAEQRRADDALMLNCAGRVVCGSVGNLFVRRSGRWITPPLFDGVLPGLARHRLIGLLDAAEAPISVADVGLAEAAFLSNCLGLAPIREIDGRALDDPDCPLPESRLFGLTG